MVTEEVMMIKQNNGEADIGIIGLGVMGHNLLLNMSDHGFVTAGYDKDESKVAVLAKEPAERKIHSTTDIKKFIFLFRHTLINKFYEKLINKKLKKKSIK